MKVAMIWAMSQNRTIGLNNDMPWRLPNDLKYFKQVTLGKPVIMGRKTFDSLGKPLVNRENIVITRQENWHKEGARVTANLDQALALAKDLAKLAGQDEVIIMGGAEIYNLGLPVVDKLYLTQIHAHIDGDTHFPEFDLAAFREVSREDHQASGDNPYDYSFLVYEK